VNGGFGASNAPAKWYGSALAGSGLVAIVL
jgi:hypothetical protein